MKIASTENDVVAPPNHEEALLRVLPVIGDRWDQPISAFDFAVSGYHPRPRSGNDEAIALLKSWLANPDPDDEKGWAALEPELPRLGARFGEPE